VLGITFIITIFAGVYVYRQMGKTKKILLDEQAVRMEAKRNLKTSPYDEQESFQ
jgi:hypothetical protein